MTTTQDSNNNYLDSLLMSFGRAYREAQPSAIGTLRQMRKTRDKINSHMLSEALELIGEDMVEDEELNDLERSIHGDSRSNHGFTVGWNSCLKAQRRAFKDKYEER